MDVNGTVKNMEWILGYEAPNKLFLGFNHLHHITERGKGAMIFKNITTECNLCHIIFESMHFKIWTYFLFSPRDDPRVTSLAKHKEFDELVHWHSHRPLSDDYDRTKCQFDGEPCDW